MNRHEVFLYVGNLVHVFIWFYIFCAWCLYFWNAEEAKAHVLFILIIILPLAYIVQSLPCHFILFVKMNYVQVHRSAFRSLPMFPFDHTDQCIVQNIARALKWDVKKVYELMSVVKWYEHDLYIPRLVENVKRVFDGRSFLNPLSPQGMLIIGYIINVAAFLFFSGCFSSFVKNTVLLP